MGLTNLLTEGMRAGSKSNGRKASKAPKLFVVKGRDKEGMPKKTINV